MTTLGQDATAATVHRTLVKCLAANPKTREPMNALVAWTELGKGLAGTLEDVGGERGLLRKIICAYGLERGAEVDLSRWAYRLERELRLDPSETAAILRRAEGDLSRALRAHVDRAERSPDARRALFIAVVKGWFPVGLDIMRALPAGSTASDEALLGALAAWCERHLPSGEEGAEQEAPAPRGCACRAAPRPRSRRRAVSPSQARRAPRRGSKDRCECRTAAPGPARAKRSVAFP